MNFLLIARFFKERKMYRRVVEELEFITYRELRDLALQRAAKPAARES